MANVTERVEGPTPAGGAYAIAIFSRAGVPVPKEQADAAEITEYDAEGRVILRTYGRIGGVAGAPFEREP